MSPVRGSGPGQGRAPHDAESRYRDLFDHVPVALFHSTPEGRILEANAFAAEMLGFPSPESLKRRNARDLLADPALFPELMAELERAGVIRDLETPLRRYDGSTIWCVNQVRALRDDSGAIDRIESAASDVTARHVAEEEHSRLAAIVRSSQDAIIGTSLDGIMTSWNGGAERLYGYSAAEALGTSIARLMPGSRTHEFHEIRGRVLAGERVEHFETERVRRDGSIVRVLLAVSPILDARERVVGVAVVARDIGARKAAEEALRSHDRLLDGLLKASVEVSEVKETAEELRRALARAEQADRLKTAFLANVSHEIRTPLNIISGFTDLVSERAAELGDTALISYLPPIARATQRLLGTIDGILDIAKIQTDSFAVSRAEIALEKIVSAEIEKLEKRARDKGLELSFDPGDAKALVWFDRYCLTQAVHHLLDNAIKFTESGWVRVRIARDADHVLVLEIADSGIGIEAEFAARLFAPFLQEDVGSARRYEGIGLGLALVKRYVELNGAEITLEAEKGRGSTFRIRFPRAIEVDPRRSRGSEAP